MPPAVPDSVLFVGRLHPLLVHLPIGFLLLLAVFEALVRFQRFKGLAQARGVILTMALAASIVTAICGWLLAKGGGYDAALLAWHRWTGVAVAAGVLLACLAQWRGFDAFYRGALLATLLVMAVASHHGGTLTHGRGYLTRYAPAPLRHFLGSRDAITPKAPTDLRQAVVFTQIVQPILQGRCADCHGEENFKGGLRVDSYEALLRGGQSGPAIDKGKSAMSRLIHHMQLPLNHGGHMPPRGKPQPGPEELSILSWWIDAGAPTDKTVAALGPTPVVMRALETMFGPQGPDVPPLKLADLESAIARLRSELGIGIEPIAANEPWLACSANPNGPFCDAQLEKLGALGPNIRWLNLSGTKISDAGLRSISGWANITRLHLDRTGITDAGLACLANLRYLEYLNLHGTAVGNAGLRHLSGLARLQKLYLWQTKVTPEAARTFAADLTDRQQIRRWQLEIEDIRSRIRGATPEINIGANLPADTATLAVDRAKPARAIAAKTAPQKQADTGPASPAANPDPLTRKPEKIP